MRCGIRIARLCSVHIFVAVGLALLGFIALPVRVQAQAFHAQYDHSLPAANARLQSGQPPASVQVWFTERIEPDFSNLAVYDQSKRRVDANDSHMLSDNAYSLGITLRPHLPDGAYTVVFQNVSRDDGHHVVGALSFVVGGGALPTSADNAQTGLVQSRDDNLNVWSIVIRWLNYLPMAAFVGMLAFLLFVWRPMLTQLAMELGSTFSIASGRVQAGILRLLLGSLLALTAGWVTMVLYQAGVASGRTLWQLFSDQTVLRYITGSHFGNVWLVRLGLIILAFLIWHYGLNRKRDSKQTLAGELCLLLIGIAIMVTTALNSHAAANQSAWLLIPLDVLHLVSTGFWIGGLLSLVAVIPLAVEALVPGTGDRTRFFARLLPRFSRIFIVSVIILVITGSGEAIVQLPAFAALLSSSYGRALDIKLLLFCLLLCLGAYNLLRITPRMRAFASSSAEKSGASSLEAGKLQRTFGKVVRTEALLIMLLLLVVGGLTSLSPPPMKDISTTGGPYVRQGQAANLNYRLVINPGKIGENTIEVTLTDSGGQPVSKADAVIVRFMMLDMTMGVQEAYLEPAANRPGYYTTRSSDLSMAGLWQVILIIRRAGFDDIRTSFSSKF